MINNNFPKDPVMLLSVVNTKLRDYYDSLDEFCQAEDVDRDELIQLLQSIDYTYDAATNRFD